MNPLLVVSNIVLWMVILLLGFLLLGALRTLGMLTWRLDELEVTRPTRMGRSGLQPGKRAPDFELPDVEGNQVGLRDFSGRKVLLIFVQPGCGPCHEIIPELNRVHRAGEACVLAINNAEPDEARTWFEEVRPQFPVVVQQHWSVSKRYEIFATPFAYLIDERGIITSRGVAGNRQYLEYVLTGAGNRANHHHVDSELYETAKSETKDTFPSKEVTHA